MKVFRIMADVNNIKFDKVRCEVKQKSPWFRTDFYVNEKIEINGMPIIEFETINSALSDIPYSPDAFLVSDKFYKIIKQMNNKTMPISSNIYKKDKLITDNYFVVIFFNQYSVVDWERSNCRREYDIAYSIRKLVLSKNQIDKIPKNEMIFASKEAIGYILITEEGKKIVENAGISGVMFEEIEVS